MWGKRILYLVLAVVVLVGGIFAAFKLSPWPSVLLIRYAFAGGAATAAASMQPFVPSDIVERLDERYGKAAAERVDVFRKEGSTGQQPTVVWIHGGAFIGGDKRDLAPYLKILADKGYTTVAVGYTIAPTAKYPTPVIQANAALGWLVENAARLGIDPNRIFLAGDSAGAHIAAQLAAGVVDPAYAAEIGFKPSIERSQISTLLLMCGVYSMQGIEIDGPFAAVLRTVIWSYLGTPNFSGDPRVEQFAADHHLTPAYPPAFITAGNADPLEPQSRRMAKAIAAQGVEVETLFYPKDYAPALPHEYQFDFNLSEGRQSLESILAFMEKLR